MHDHRIHLASRLLAFAALTLLAASPARSFCGFYVAKADSKLFNQASQVVLVRQDDKTVLTMSNDYKGEAKEFAIVVPVPTVLEKDQIHVGDSKVLDHLDAYSAPRLVEYHDDDPCRRVGAMQMGAFDAPPAAPAEKRAEKLGVTIEARYTVGEYDILILSAKQSGGLETWLIESGYKIPAGASGVLGSYIKQGMKFFVAKVNLAEKARLGYANLRPLQIAYESPKFMLPIRLGMVNADGPQELFIYALTRKGRVETTNYRTVKLPTGMDIPVYVKDEFGKFYKAMFAEQVRREDMRAVFLEYAWDMNWCDPCAADPLSREELRGLGVFWLGGKTEERSGRPTIMPPGGGAQEVFLTRLHVRYDAAHFPEDLVFQETADRENFQGRYVLRHPWKGQEDGQDECDAAANYRRDLRERREIEAKTLATLTGWKLQDIRRKMQLNGSSPKPVTEQEKKWYQRIWE